MISCALYDYIEIACMYKYQLKLTLKSGDVINGSAIDTKRDNERQECIAIQQDQKITLIKLEAISALETSSKNPHFNKISFV